MSTPRPYNNRTLPSEAQWFAPRWQRLGVRDEDEAAIRAALPCCVHDSRMLVSGHADLPPHPIFVIEADAPNPQHILQAAPHVAGYIGKMPPHALHAILAPAGYHLPYWQVARPRLIRILQQGKVGKTATTLLAVTGTNGKTSTVDLIRQLAVRAFGITAGSLGTIGGWIESPSNTGTTCTQITPAGLTSPSPAGIHEAITALEEAGATLIALEASSHGLAQYRLDGIDFAAAGFTNLTRDHLDYHLTFADYRTAKWRLFDELAPRVTVISDATESENNEESTRLFAHLRAQNRNVVPAPIEIGASTIDELALQAHATRWIAPMRKNLRLALGLLMQTVGQTNTPANQQKLADAIPQLQVIAGRYEEAAPRVFVDYAHTPDALDTVLQAAIAQLAPGERLITVFGCGGDRDRGKRPQMGAVVAKHARPQDIALVTDDNPRSENPESIRRDAALGFIRAAQPMVPMQCQPTQFSLIDGRGQAIFAALTQQRAQDVVIIAGKGHENTQTVGDKTLPFDDRDEVRRISRSLDSPSLFTANDVVGLGGDAWVLGDAENWKPWQEQPSSDLAFQQVHFDSRALVAGALFFALDGEHAHGVDFLPHALAAGAIGAVVSKEHCAAAKTTIAEHPTSCCGFLLMVAESPLQFMRDLGEFRRARHAGRFVAITGSVGKTTVKFALAAACSSVYAEVFVAPASYNNLLGVSYTLCNMPPSAQVVILEIGTNHPGEIEPLAKLAAPHLAVITHVTAAHSVNFPDLAAIAREKSALIKGLTPGGSVILPEDIPYRSVFVDLASEQWHAGIITACISSEGISEKEENTYRLGWQYARGDHPPPAPTTTLEVTCLLPGQPWQHNSALAITAAVALGVAPAEAAICVWNTTLPRGRGDWLVFPRPTGTVWLYDDSYNANPASMRAGLATFARLTADIAAPRIAVIGEMRELDAPAMEMAALAPLLRDFDRVLLIGDHTDGLCDMLGNVASHLPTAGELLAELSNITSTTSAIFAKGSLGSGVYGVIGKLRAALFVPDA